MTTETQEQEAIELPTTSKDIFFTTEYGKLYEGIENGVCEVFKNDAVSYMFIKRPVPWLIDGIQYYDVITPYGYGGPLSEHNICSEEVKSFFKAWEHYCKDKRIIAEFVRFHLFDNVAFREAFPGEVIHVSENVVRQLGIDMDTMWMQFDHKVRKNVKKATSNNLTVTADLTGEHLQEFLEIYYATMERNEAKNYFYFKSNYFESIERDLAGHYAYFHVWYEEKIISTELVIYGDKYVYSFLGGTLDEYYAMRPNDLLKYEIIKWCKDTGKEFFILGGGYGENDGIYRYKKAFAPDGDVPFYVGRSVHDYGVYNRLIDKRREQGEFNENTQFFPKYRS